MDLNNIDLLSLQSKHMQKDITTQGLCAALNPQLRQIADSVDECLILPRVDDLSEEVLDILAVDLHIDWYNPSADIDVKRNLIKSSDKVHMYLGTPYAVEQLMQDYFGDGTVEEWYEYSGVQGHFRVVTSNPSVSGDLADQFVATLEKVKRRSARLDSIIVTMSAEFPIYMGFAVHIGDFIQIEQVV